MATTKSFTDLSQSKTLSEILSPKSADMTYYACVKDWRGNPVEPKWGKPATLTKEELALPCSNFQEYEYVPCWSLASLLEQIPYEMCDDDGNSSYLQINKEGDAYQLVYEDPYGNFESIETDRYEHFVDACCEMIIKLNELNLL